ncbi:MULTISPECIES: ShlB/FhaC/HecB family hemolysin secretion/activation protein [Nostocales]|uniref:Hemolysin activation/secretion protein n=3 Tax=Nostocales TaxID=1161 RepID=A0A0C1N387_9CYAN|nr:ShlB/FhaC/HecB family hemolysin secretion/activation protein [Tolypothrix bouteillei]KAF3889714.1 ShlB/FhaC/HecB family hemolysin secretion/activation protein [Tolypothrix bouteillei VB521301]
MSRGKVVSWLKLNLVVGLIFKVLITSYACEASAESLPMEGLKETDAIPPQFETSEFTYSNTVASTILSQVPNPITPVPPPPQPIPAPEPPPETPLDITPTTPSPSQTRPDIPGSIRVIKFEFEGNTAFSDRKLSEITAEFIDKPIPFSKLLEVEAAIAKLYIDAGYINSGAFIPAGQTLSPKGAVVKVQIVEGGVEEIKITGTRRLNPNYIRSRLKLGTSQPFNRNRLLKALQLLQLNPLIENLSAELSPGSRLEQGVLEVKVVEADSFRTEFFLDNARAPSVGSFRRGVRISEGNVFGLGDGFDAIYTNTDGSNSLDLSYTVPINPRNGSISLAGGFTDTTVIEPPFDQADITGNSFYIDIGFRQPIIQTPNREFALGLNLVRQQSLTEVEGESFPLSPGADENGETRISALRFVQEYIQRSPQQVLAVRSQFNLGVAWLDATINSDAPDSRFFSWRGQGQYVRLLARDTLLVLRSNLQLATRALVPLEQIGIGGLQSVRGYRQDQLLVDNGFFASAEFRLPVLRVQDIQGVLQVVPFIDFGIGWNSSGESNPDPDRNTLLGVGLGLQWQMGNNLNARFDYGIPLIDVESRERTLQEQGFYFSVNYSPF